MSMFQNLKAPAVQKIAKGPGRTYVVGDIHGLFELLEQALALVSFDPEIDRLILVGDLIDRGPHSPACLHYLAQDWVFAVKGNHEQMLLDLYEEGEPLASDLDYYYEHNGLGWWKHVPEQERSRYLSAFAKLPSALEIESNSGLVGVVHADVPLFTTWQDFTSRLNQGCMHTQAACHWSRTRISHGDLSGVAGIEKVFVGHTPQLDGAKAYANVIALDTGAVFGWSGLSLTGHLSIANIDISPRDLARPLKKEGIWVYEPRKRRFFGI